MDYGDDVPRNIGLYTYFLIPVLIQQKSRNKASNVTSSFWADPAGIKELLVLIS
jgi:hypothetical protein